MLLECRLMRILEGYIAEGLIQEVCSHSEYVGIKESRIDAVKARFKQDVNDLFGRFEAGCIGLGIRPFWEEFTGNEAKVVRAYNDPNVHLHKD